MGGGGIPGPETGNQDEAAPGNIGQSGADEPGPVAASDGVQQSIVVTGWPRSISWSDFSEIDSRPAGENEDAQIKSETMTSGARTRRVGGQWLLAELEVDIVVDDIISWVVRSRKSRVLKAHEQGHFDIHGLIVGRDLVEDIKAIRARNNNRLGAAVRQTMVRARRRGRRMTNTYDSDTRHGLDTERQAAWEARIRNAIDNNVRLRAPS